MATPPRPPPTASQPGYGLPFTPPSTSTPRPERRATPPPFSSPLASRVSPHQEHPTSPSPDGGAQFSTPPGPPVFASPLRPAAVPFPSTPPPPTFFSPSPLPPSSHPAPFSNGSHDHASHPYPYPSPQTIPLDFDSDAAAPYVLFSARKVLKSKKLLNTPSLGFGALVSPGREIGPSPQIVQRDPHRCHNCGAYVNIYCNILIDSGKWLCVICKNLNESGGEYVVSRREDLPNWPELSSVVVDYVQMGNTRPGFIPVPDSRLSAPVFLVVDEGLDEVHLQHLQSSLHAFVDCLPITTRLGIISYGRTVSVYDFSEDGIASADVLPGDKSPTEESLKALIYGTGIYLAPIHVLLRAAHSIISSLRPCKIKTAEVMRDRCIGTAVEVALAIIQGPTAETLRGLNKRSGDNCRILVCSGGPNTYGAGSVPHSLSHPNYPYMEKTAIKWMENLGHKAQHHNVVIDILCAGTCPVRVPVLQPLAKASGGVLVLHDDFGEAFGVNLQRATKRAAGSHGLFEIRCSDDIIVSRVIGPGEEAAGDAHESFKNDNSTCIQMFSVEDTQSFTLFMETTSDIKNDNVFFQFSVRYSNIYQSDILRIFTVRLPTVDSVAAYLGSIQEEIASVLVAKKTVLLAETASDAIDMRLTIDERVKDIALKYGSQIPKSKLHRFPKELPFLAEHLFHLKRGPLLGGVVGHEDERSVLRNLFLHASFDLAFRMVAPRCMMHREGGSFEELPAYDLAMQSDAAVVLDHGTDVFIWLGNELAAQEGRSAASLAACRTLAEELTDNRFPAPRILAFKEGSSQARYLVSRLIPAHKDPPYEQEARFPQLRTLTVEQRAKLKSSFLHFDDFSFCEWMRSLKVVPPEPS